MPTWEEIFTSSNPAGGRMINVISGVAGSEASPYTADNPSGGRAINVNLIGGGSVATGVLQIQGGVPLDTTLRAVTDQANTVSPLQLSTTQVGIYYPNGTFNGGLSITGGADGGGGTTSFVDFIPNKSTPTYYHAIGFTYDNSNWLGFYRGSRASAALAFGNDLIWTPSYNVAIGHTSASARLHVRGDGTNPIARFESSAGVEGLSLTSTLATFAQRIIVTALPATRPATVGEFYQDTAANILANGDKVVGIRQ